MWGELSHPVDARLWPILLCGQNHFILLHVYLRFAPFCYVGRILSCCKCAPLPKFTMWGESYLLCVYLSEAESIHFPWLLKYFPHFTMWGWFHLVDARICPILLCGQNHFILINLRFAPLHNVGGIITSVCVYLSEAESVHFPWFSANNTLLLFRRKAIPWWLSLLFF